MKLNRQTQELEIPTLQAPTAEVVQLPRRRRQADLLEADDSMSEFEWARVTCKTWDMEQG